mgnify:CR=1 FL=1|jgi:PBP1b-binding outer membrane lipoprotein LpoB
MKKKRLIASMLFLGCIILSGCYPAGYVIVKDYGKQMELIKVNFPEIYKMYCNGLINITEVYTYPAKDGTERVHVSYQHLR